MVLGKLPNFIENIKKINDSHLLNALFRDYAFLASAYLLEDVYLDYVKNDRVFKTVGKSRLTASIAEPLHEIAKKLGCNPYLEYQRSSAINNYIKINPNEKTSRANLKVIRQFTGLESESNFYLQHLLITNHSYKIVK